MPGVTVSGVAALTGIAVRVGGSGRVGAGGLRIATAGIPARSVIRTGSGRAVAGVPVVASVLAVASIRAVTAIPVVPGLQVSGGAHPGPLRVGRFGWRPHGA